MYSRVLLTYWDTSPVNSERLRALFNRIRSKAHSLMTDLDRHLLTTWIDIPTHTCYVAVELWSHEDDPISISFDPTLVPIHDMFHTIDDWLTTCIEKRNEMIEAVHKLLDGEHVWFAKLNRDKRYAWFTGENANTLLRYGWLLRSTRYSVKDPSSGVCVIDYGDYIEITSRIPVEVKQYIYTPLNICIDAGELVLVGEGYVPIGGKKVTFTRSVKELTLLLKTVKYL